MLWGMVPQFPAAELSLTLSHEDERLDEMDIL
jgi:hypothetical protein